MKRTFPSIVAISCLLIISIAFSCKNKTPKKVDAGFSKYVSAFTSGVISTKSDIKVHLTNDYSGEINLNKEIDANLFSFTPKLQGKAYWTNKRTIVFVPDQPLASGEEYQVNFKLSELLKVPPKYAMLKFHFKTIKQSFSFTSIGLESYQADDMFLQRYKGHISTADFIESDDIEKVVFAEQDGEKLDDITWTHSAEGKTHNFVVDGITRKDDASQLLIKWDGSSIGLDEKGEKEIEIPAINVFKITETRVIQQPEQYVSIRFSDPLLTPQNLKGLIRLSDDYDDYYKLKFVIAGSEIKAYPENRLTGNKTLKIEEGIKNSLSYSLKESKNISLTFESIKPAVRLIGKGTIMPSSTGLILPFEAVSLKAVDIRLIEIFENNITQFLQKTQMNGVSQLNRAGRLVLQKRIDLDTDKFINLNKWNTYSLDISDLIQVKPGSIYHAEIRFKKEYSLYSCAEDDGENETDETEKELQKYYDKQTFNEELDQWDAGYYSDYYRPENFSWRESENPCSTSYYYYENFVSRNIFASDLGLIAKAGNDRSITFAVTDLLSADPINGVKLEVYNYQNQLLSETKTDKDGLAKVEIQRKPFLLVAKKGDQRGYLRLDDGSSLSLSNFNVAGSVIQKGIKGYIYGERGVWRPGDNLYLTFILEDKGEILPENHPVIFELINPLGQTVTRKVNKFGNNGFYSFTTPTDAEAPTGNWTAKVKVGGTIFTKIIRIETVKPNRLKINLDFDTDVLKKGSQQTKMEVKWLHGAVARNMNTNIILRLSPRRTSFKNFAGYTFDDRTKNFYSSEKLIFDGKINENGIANVGLNLSSNESAPGMLNAGFITRVFEESGDFSIDMQNIPFAPYNNFVGIKMPESDRGWYLTDTVHRVQIATVNADGKPTNTSNLRVQVYKIDWRWWWDSSDDNIGSYINRASTRTVIDAPVSTKNGKAVFDLNIEYRNWEDYGRYLIQVSDYDSGHSTSTTAYFSKWYGRVPEGMMGNAALLSFTSDKNKYKPGEKAEITIPSSKSGKALISLETGATVLKAFWVDAKETETKFSFEITPDMSPNIYVNATLIQPHAQTENDCPIRMYGVIPIMVEDPDTRLNPTIKMPDILEPEEIFEVKVSEKDDKPMTYTIAVVDDGLLDLTRFRTPNAWNTFYAREALGVKSWDMYNLVMGAFGARLEKAFAIGGDGDEGEADEEDKKQSKANRFKPVVMFFGPYDLGAGDTKTHQITMPNYIGSVRTMIVAGNKGAYGSAEKTTPVRKPLMILATLPRVLGPGENVKLPVTVFAMDKKIKKVKLKIESNDLLNIEGDAEKEIIFDKIGDKIVNFDLKVASKLGVAKVKVIAESKGTKATYEIELDVRNPNPRVVNLSDALLKSGESWDKNIELPGMEGTNKGMLELSSIPPIDFGRRLDYLIQFPHGCIEQTTSSVFPQLFLDRVLDLDNERKQEISENIRAALNRLMKFQLTDGGFSYWPGGDYPSDWGTSYAGHFILKAEEAGYTLPYGLKSGWIKYQKTAAQDWSSGDYRGGYYYKGSNLLQAYRLYTLALAESPDLGAMNRLRGHKDLSEKARWRLAAAYTLIGQKEVAAELIDQLSTTVKDYREHSGTFGSGIRDRAMILETMSLLDRKSQAFSLLEEISKELSSDSWMSTQTTAYCLLAVAEFVGKSSDDSMNLNFEYSINGKKSKKLESNRPLIQIPLTFDDEKPSVKVTNHSGAVLYARVNVSGIPITGDKVAASNNLKLSITYRDMSGSIIDVSQLKQGTDFKAEVSVRHTGVTGHYEQLALTQIFPSGWEIINTRFGDIPEKERTDEREYSEYGDEKYARHFTYQDIRDDRIYTYFNLKKSTKKTFTIMLNSAYLGRFYLPTVSCEAMYDNRVNARQPGKWVEVVK